jgi:hypothetical protein
VDSDGFSAVMYKRKSFEHEREVRIATTNRLYAPVREGGDRVDIVPGVRLAVALEQLLQRVVIAPTASALFMNSAVAVVRKFGWIRLPVHRSDLEKSPLY